MIKKFFLIQEAISEQQSKINKQKAQKLLPEIIDAIKNSGWNGDVPLHWISGSIQKLTPMIDLSNDLRSNDELTRSTALSRQAMFNVLASKGLVTKISDEKFKKLIGPKFEVQRDILSKLAQLSPQNMNTQLNAKDPNRIEKQIQREKDFQEAEQIKKDLTEIGYGHVINVLQNMESIDFSYLNNLISEYEKAKEKVRRSKKRNPLLTDVRLGIFDDHQQVSRLRNLGFIKGIDSRPRINTRLINDTIEMLGELDQRKIIILFKKFSKDLYHSVKRASSDQTYKENAFIRRIYNREPSVVAIADKIIGDDLLDDEEKEQLLNQMIQPSNTFIRLGIIKNGELTDVGKAVRILVRWNKKSVKDALESIQFATGRPDPTAYNPNTPDRMIPSNTVPNRNLDAVDDRRNIADTHIARKLGNVAAKGTMKESFKAWLDRTQKVI